MPPVVSVQSEGNPGVANLGHALLTMANAIGIAGPCSDASDEYGVDGEFCTMDDPVSSLPQYNRGALSLSVFGTDAVATIVNPADSDDFLGPFGMEGAPFTCQADGSVDVSGGGIAAAFTACDSPNVGDSITPMVLFFDRAPTL